MVSQIPGYMPLMTVINTGEYYPYCEMMFQNVAIFLFSISFFLQIKLFTRISKELWGFHLEEMSDSWQRTDWTLKEMERDEPLLSA